MRSQPARSPRPALAGAAVGADRRRTPLADGRNTELRDLRPTRECQRREAVMKTACTIRYISGREEKFETELLGGAGAQARMEAFVKSPTVLLKTSDEVLIIPGTAIECISIKLQKGDDWSNFVNLRPAKRIK